MSSRDDTSPTTAFFYGTLMVPEVLRRVIFGEANPSKDSTKSRPMDLPHPALLIDYQRHRVKGADYPAIIPRKGASVRGTLVTGLTEGDWWRLDAFEGSEYVKKVVQIRVNKKNAQEQLSTGHEWDTLDENDLKLNGEDVWAQTYVWIAKEAFLEDKEWDFNEFKKEKMWRWAGLSAEHEGEYEGNFPLHACTWTSNLARTELDEAVADAGDPTGGRDFRGGHLTSAVKQVNDKELESAV
jgi:hypothetical protein